MNVNNNITLSRSGHLLSWGVPFFIILGIFLSLSACRENAIRSDAYGNFEATEINVSAESSGRLISLNVEEGQILQKGDILGYIDTLSLSLKKKQLIASIKALKAKIQPVQVQIDVLEERKKNLNREKERVLKLLEEDAATQKQLDDLEGELEVIDKQINATRTQLMSANTAILSEIEPLQVQILQIEDQIDKSIIKCPVEGTVLVTYAEEGELAAIGSPLFLMADLSQMYLRAYISGTQLQQINLGDTIEVLIDDAEGGLSSFEGQLSWISDKAEFTPKIIQTKEERVNLVYAVKIKVLNDGRLKIGMPAEARF